MQQYLVSGSRPILRVMLAAALALLGVALANVLNLLLIRGLSRQGEMALRRALGARPSHLALRVGSEVALLAVAGALGAAVLARWAVALVAASPIDVPRLAEVRLDARIQAFVVVLTLISVVLGSAILLSAAWRSKPLVALSSWGRGQPGSRRGQRVRSVLIVLQVAFAVLLTAVSATMVKSLVLLQRVELGYRPDSVFVARLSLPPEKYGRPADIARFTGELQTELEAGPGVLAAGVVSIAPLSGLLSSVPWSVAGRPPVNSRERAEANFRAISSGYLPAIGASLASGRLFSAADDEAAPRVAIISRALADEYFAASEPLGQRLLIDDNDTGPRPVTVVGVIHDMRHVNLDGPPTYDIFIPMAQVHPDGVSFVVGNQFWTARVAYDATDYPATFLQALAQVDRDVAVAGVEPMRTYIDDNLAPRWVSVSSLLAFAIVALVLAAMGVYSVIAYLVEQRRREIGLRLALGATSKAVAWSVIRPAAALAAAGVAIGMILALLSRQVIAGLLFGVSPTDPAVLLVVSLLLIATSTLAAAIPARRAARLDPLTTLAEP
jgi:predicted permease